jgi:PBSX family phage terminase large subunit
VVAAALPSTRELRLYPRQMRFVRDPAPFVAMVGGIGSGKSLSGAAKLISRIDKKELGGVYAPTYPMLRDATMRTLFGLFDDLGIGYRHHKAENIITIPASGHEILCRSLDNPDATRGPNLCYAWVDEASLVAAEAWRIIKGRVRVGSNPQTWVTFTPKGRNFLWEEFERDANPDHPLYRVRTDENPALPEHFAQSLGYTGRFAEQELGGQFVAFEGVVYPGFRQDQLQTVDCTGWQTVLGLDLGTRNPTCILTVRHSGDRIHVQRELYERGMGSDDVADAAVSEYKRTKPQFLVVDPSAAGLIVSLRKRGLKVRKANNDVIVGIGRVTSALPDMTFDPSCVNTAAEFGSYAYPDGKNERDIPVKSDDHAMDVLRYVTMELTSPRKVVRIY